MWLGLIAAALALFGLALFTALHSHWLTEDRASAIGTLSAISTVLALAVGAAWYFVERPEDAKLKIDHSISAYPFNQSYALIVGEVSINNVGKTAINLSEQQYKVILQRITPVPDDVRVSIQNSHSPDGLPLIDQADVWDGGLVAAYPSGRLSSVIEAGETENLYFRAIVSCRLNSRLYFQTQFEKPGRRWPKRARTAEEISQACSATELCWVKQSVVDLVGACRRGAK